MSFLRACLDVLFPPRTSAFRVSQATLAELGELASPSLIPHDTFEIMSLLPYRAPLVRSLILEAKYHEHVGAHALLGAVLADYLLSLLEERAFDQSCFALVPVPLSKKRHRERGYNQTERIVQEALKLLPDTFSLDTRLVRRVRDTSPQTKLGRSARLKNMDGAFSLAGVLATDTTYIVIDDVTTTGATIGAVMQVLPEQAMGISLAH